MENRIFVFAALIFLYLGGSLIFMNTVSFSQDLSQCFGIGVIAGPVKMIGGQKDRSTIDQWAGMKVAYNLDQSLAFNATLAYGWVYPKAPGGSHFESSGNFKTILNPFEMNLVYKLLPQSKIRPVLSFGTGMMLWDIRKLGKNATTFSRGVSVNGSQFNASLIGGAGFEFLLYKRFVLNLMINYHRLLKGEEDTIGYGDDDNNAVAELQFGLSYFFSKNRDYDNDGVENKYDLEPNKAEDIDGFQDSDGAPDYDNDNDGIPDVRDKAPNDPEDFDGFQDDDGIPDYDNDRDSIKDADDKCINTPEDFDGFEDHDGCPEYDNDKDGIPDSLDQCPNWPEDMNGYRDDDGCPDEKPEKKSQAEPEPAQINVGTNIILKGVTFASGSAQLNSSAFPVLEEIFRTLVDFPTIAIEIRGYTDDIGDFNANKALSERRAFAVRKYLLERGIDPNQIRAVGFGELDPIDTNATSEGRSVNRRIEFVRIK
jgi:outer membrane protein OmpA-like peptidoglycan-associated protein